MKTLAVCLWKEWRDQRATVLGFLALLLTLAPIAAFVLPRAHLQTPSFVEKVTISSLLVCIIAIGVELFPGELQRRKLGFLERLPAGLAAPFLAKVSFFALALPAFGLCGYLVASALRTLRIGGGEAFDIVLPGSFAGGLLLLSLSAGLWAITVSCWLPRGVVTIPAAAGFVGLLALPFVRLDQAVPRGIFHGSRGAWEVLWFAQPLIALGAAWFSFVKGRAFGRGHASAAWRGLLVTLLCFGPIWTFGALRVLDLRHVDPHAKGFQIWGGQLGAGGRLAFLNTQGRASRFSLPVIVDLRTGAWRQAGGPNALFRDFSGHRLSPTRHAWPHRLVMQSTDGLGIDIRDGGTGALLRSVPRDMVLRVAPGARAWLREMTPMRLPDGRRVWFFGRVLEQDGRDGAPEPQRWFARDVPHGLAGFGIRIFIGHGEFVVYDVIRQRRFDDYRFSGAGASYSSVWVLPSSWLVARTKGQGPRLRTLDWRLLEPETGLERPARGIEDSDRPITVLDDGRILVLEGGQDRAARHRVLIVTPDSGDRLPIATPGIEDPVMISEPDGVPTRTPDGRRVFLFFGRDHGRSLAVLEPGSKTFTRAVPAGSLLACPTDETAIVIDQDRRHLLRIHLETGAREVLFPR